jgi:K319-like protein
LTIGLGVKPRASGIGRLVTAALLFSTSVSGTTIVVNDSRDLLHSPGCATSGLGLCTLRDALTFANANPGPDSVQFNVTGAGLHTIVLSSALPPLTDPSGTTIDGYTQPGAAVNTLTNSDNALLLIELKTNSSSPTIGIDVESSNNLLRGLIVNSFDTGVLIQGGGSGNVVGGCFIGTDFSGTFTEGGIQGVLVNGSANTLIGGANPADRNVLSGNNLSQIWVAGGIGTRIIGNFIGLERGGAASLPGGAVTDGVRVTGGQDTGIGGTAAGERNVISGFGAAGIRVAAGAFNTSIAGNWIGLNAGGTAPIGNTLGVFVAECSCGRTTIGGTQLGASNVISGNADGIDVVGSVDSVVIQGNRIGTDPAGLTATGNSQRGIAIELASGVIVGGSVPGAGNLISGNALGVWIENRAVGTVIRGNLIGTDASGNNPLPNSAGGILIEALSTNSAVGGSVPGDANVIAFNGGPGIQVGNANSPFSLGNTILSNNIHGNQGLGIDLTLTTPADGVTANDPGDADTGPNGLQNFPVLTGAIRSATSPRLLIRGTQDSNPATGANRLQFFLADGDSSGHGEGESLLLDFPGQPAGAFSFDTPVFVPPTPVVTGNPITATATTSDGTSEFSANILVVSNQAPTADAGPSQTVSTGLQVILNGASSRDADGLPFGSAIRSGFFTWTQTSGPPVTLANATSATPSFFASAPGTYVFNLVVSDGLDASTNAATVLITAAGAAVAIPTLRPVAALLLAMALMGVALWLLRSH